MKNITLKIGQIVTYKVCNSIYQGTIVKITNDKLVIIDCEDGMTLFNAGYSIGDEISKSQILYKK
jgi:hypothetical protein